MDIQLKDFQTATLNKLREYLGAVRLSNDPEQAFLKIARTENGATPRYNKIAGLESIPYVCLRLPTGGGKTIVGAYAIRVAAESYIEKDFPVVLWLVPSNTIRLQTADALKNTSHPYRMALDEAFDGRVRVFDISEIENIRPADIAQSVCVVVATIQTLRVEQTAGRDVYAHKEALEGHFTSAALATPGLEKIEGGNQNAGKVKYSFANLLKVHRPLIIMDEAHNARTPLTFDTLQRLSPCCIVELTATPSTHPQNGSNVLHRVSAAQLKAEAMIKLPIALTVHDAGWQQAIGDALRTRKRLATLAAGEPDYIRPILLIQAESRDKPANVDAVKQHLLESEQIPAESIAVATGDQRELDQINLFAQTCPIEVVITVQALKEGWDCSFAYVFCSTANISNSRDVEQLLGRVLRMPYARRRKALELNKAYAHVASAHFGEAAKNLKDSLIDMGFEAAEAPQLIETYQPSDSLFTPIFVVEKAPDLSGLSAEEQQAVVVITNESGETQIKLTAKVTEAVEERVLAVVSEAARAMVKEKIDDHNALLHREPSPSDRGESFSVPRLWVEYQGELELFDKELVLNATNWNLLDYPADLSAFQFNDSSKTFEFDVEGSRVVYKLMGEQQLDLNLLAADWTDADLVRWLDRQLRQQDVNQGTLAAWLLQAVRGLLQKDGLGLPALVRAKFILARKLGELIEQSRQAAYNKDYQALLDLSVTDDRDEYAFHFDPLIYPASSLYQGSYRFTKHFYPLPGEMKSSGEEFDCALALDAEPNVKYWVRNLSKQPTASFWLQTATDRFYPDFVAQLTDGRVLVVEYKGDGFATNDDSNEKRALGELWEKRSNGRCLFLFAEKKLDSMDVSAQIRQKLGRQH
ncbi:DEAD/DEAH box helicase [Edaphobacter bradus]|uniref:DEAD/DEAH box helicase n=1 Tax=Edaphobacter bradus TaxID=2259016 RepID=UPI0021E0DAFD|nr:DEAD/DEAH box helicase family protein [Edaphobacter bradus]